jgi:hypothetical protein
VNDLDLADDRRGIGGHEELAEMVYEQFVAPCAEFNVMRSLKEIKSHTIGAKAGTDKIRKLGHGLDVTQDGILDALQMLLSGVTRSVYR